MHDRRQPLMLQVKDDRFQLLSSSCLWLNLVEIARTRAANETAGEEASLHSSLTRFVRENDCKDFNTRPRRNLSALSLSLSLSLSLGSPVYLLQQEKL